MKTNKVFSIIVPVYNAEKTIERTLASFISNSDYIYEVILVNDKSTDSTFDKIEKFKNFFKIVVLDNVFGKGAGSARKTGLIHASSKWVTFVDADDCLTPSSLRYVYEKLLDSYNVVLLHTQSIYYESGSFNPESIQHSDTSCGGNFYLRKYLVDNELYPHNDLYMAEDEYFNEKIIKFIECCDMQNNNISYYDYPVYEVHHDISDSYSFAFRNWGDYCCKYHLLYKEYLIEDFKSYKHLKEDLFYEFCDNFIFSFFLSQGVTLDSDVDFNISDNKCYFKRALDYMKNTFTNKSELDLIHYYNTELENTNLLLYSAFSSVGMEFDCFISFALFVKSLC